MSEDDREISTPEDPVRKAIDSALVSVKRQRVLKIGRLLDTAADILQDGLDSDDPPASKLRTVELAIGLYNAQQEHDRQDKRLELQQQQFELEKEKLSAPGGALYQQNNLYLNNSQHNTYLPQAQVQIEEQAMLLQRKKAQDAILSAYLTPNKPQIVTPEEEPKE